MSNKVLNKFEYIDLFSGCGGLALGMHNAGWKALFAIEKNEDAFRTMYSNMFERLSHFNWPDWLPKTTFDINDFLIDYNQQIKNLSNPITLLAGGPPCQGFSNAGRRDESDIRNTLIDSYLEFIDIVKPESVLFENVKGFNQAFRAKSNDEKGKKYSQYMMDELEKRGYKVSYKMLDFSQFGVPQRRIRFILFASRKYNTDKFFYILNDNINSFLKDKKLKCYVTIKEAISDLETINGTISCPDSRGFNSGVYGKIQNSYQRYCRKNICKGKVPNSHRIAKHKIETVERFKSLQKLNIRNVNISKLLFERYNVKKNCFSVLDLNIPSPTLTSNPDDHIHYCEPRTLTVREYARIQSFPDDYEFKGKYTTGGEMRKHDVPRYTQIGNAIPPLVAEQLGIALKKLIEGQYCL